MSEKEKQIEIYRQALEKSSEVNRTLGLFFAFFLLYILITVASTTDLQLFESESTVVLPILDINLPLKAYYVVVPFLIIMFHYNVLFNLERHSQKLLQWKAAHSDEKSVDYDTLHPFIFNYLIKLDLSSYTTLHLLIRLVVSLFPLSLIMFIQFKFAPYHSWTITSLHFICVILDWLLLKTHSSEIKGILNSKESSQAQKVKYQKLLQYRFERWIVGFSIFHFIILFSLLKLHLLPRYFVSLFKATELLPYISLEEATLIRSKPDRDLLQLYVNEDERDISKVIKDLNLKFTRGYDLSGRDLSYANFSGANLTRCNFKGTNLNEATFTNAVLDGANFQEASMLKTNLEFAHLFRADLTRSCLQMAFMRGANLEQAVIREASLQDANLQGANLNSVNLEESDLSGADLEGSSLDSVDFQLVQLYGVNLRLCNIRGANFRLAQLKGAILRNCKISGSNFTYASLDGSDLSNSRFFGNLFEMTSLNGAIAINTDFSGSIFNSMSRDTILIFDSNFEPFEYKNEDLKNDTVKMLSDVLKPEHYKSIEQANQKGKNLTNSLHQLKEVKPYYIGLRNRLASENPLIARRMANLNSGGDSLLQVLEKEIFKVHKHSLVSFDSWFRENMIKGGCP